MYYIFNKNNEIICTFFGGEPNTEDLASRGEFAVYDDNMYDLNEYTITYENGKIVATKTANDKATQPSLEERVTELESDNDSMNDTIMALVEQLDAMSE